jgi:hypothetical protein
MTARERAEAAVKHHFGEAGWTPQALDFIEEVIERQIVEERKRCADIAASHQDVYCIGLAIAERIRKEE